jgi:autotransporter strand-loop-strand O-heptosyltransferase
LDQSLPLSDGPPAQSSSGSPPQVDVPAQPTQLGPHGIRYDFNEGCRVQVPDGNFRVQLRDLDTASILFDQSVSSGQVTSAKRYYLRFGFEVWRDGISVFRHEYDAKGKDVLARMELGGLGDC